MNKKLNSIIFLLDRLESHKNVDVWRSEQEKPNVRLPGYNAIVYI